MKQDFYYPNLYLERQVDGLIVIAPDKNDWRIQEMINIKVPFVLLNGKYDNKQVSYVDIDNYQSINMAVEYLYNLLLQYYLIIPGIKINSSLTRIAIPSILLTSLLPINELTDCSGYGTSCERYF